eukprot:366301-Chlamydomonas_euryale.AAC.38
MIAAGRTSTCFRRRVPAVRAGPAVAVEAGAQPGLPDAAVIPGIPGAARLSELGLTAAGGGSECATAHFFSVAWRTNSRTTEVHVGGAAAPLMLAFPRAPTTPTAASRGEYTLHVRSLLCDTKKWPKGSHATPCACIRAEV